MTLVTNNVSEYRRVQGYNSSCVASLPKLLHKSCVLGGRQPLLQGLHHLLAVKP